MSMGQKFTSSGRSPPRQEQPGRLSQGGLAPFQTLLHQHDRQHRPLPLHHRDHTGWSAEKEPAMAGYRLRGPGFLPPNIDQCIPHHGPSGTPPPHGILVRSSQPMAPERCLQPG